MDDCCDNSDLVTVSCDSHSKKLIAGLWNFFQSDRGIDFVIHSGRRTFRAHRIILDVFLAAEKLSQCADSISWNDYESLLEFMYRGRVTVPKAQLGSLLEAAKKSEFEMLLQSLTSATLENEVVEDVVKSECRVPRKEPTSNTDSSYKPVKRNRTRKTRKCVTLRKTLENQKREVVATRVATKEKTICAATKSNMPESVKDDDNDENPLPSEVPGKEIRGRKRKRFECDVCDKTVDSLHRLKVHKRTHTDDRSYKCVQCVDGNVAAFVRPRDLQQHLAKQHSTDTCCRPCNMLFEDGPDDLIRHTMDVHVMKHYSCDICSMTFWQPGNLDRHMAGKHPDGAPVAKKTYPCDVCGKVFPYAQSLYLHSKIHSGQKPFECEICGRCFRLKDTLNCHRETHLGRADVDKPGAGGSYNCQICEKTFGGWRLYVSHSAIHAPRPYKCDQCDKSYRIPSRLRAHRLIHTKEKSFVCAVCGKAFARRAGLNFHVRIHSGEKPYKCDLCDATFARSIVCANHRRTHTGEKPFVCEVCGRTFSHRRGLDFHKLTHTGERPHECTVCGKKFRERTHLVVHSRIHSGIKPFKCDICGMAFTQKQSLIPHSRTHRSTTDMTTSKD